MSVGLDPQLTHPQVWPNNEAQINAVRGILGLGVGALTLGAGARGLSGLGSFLSRNLGGETRTPLRQSYVRIPVPVKVRTRAERDAMLAAAEEDRDKEAGFVKLANLSASIADTLGLLRRPGQKPNMLQNAIGGWGESTGWRMPWAVPAAVGIGAGGIYGGWKLTDYLLDKTKNMEQESELEQARKDYESALAGRSKLGSAASGPLDELATLCEKRGIWNELMGPALLAGGGIALGSGLGTYNWARSLAEDKAVEEAVKRRQAQIAEQSPSPVMAIPTPMPILQPRKSHWHHLMGREPEKKKVKTANIGQAADQFLGRIRSNQMAVWQKLMTPPDAKPAKPVKPEQPAPPQLPTLVGHGVMGQPPATAAR